MRLGVFDDMARKVLVPQPLQRIVSLVPSDTETCFALGAGDRLVGRTHYCIEPAAAEAVACIGGVKGVDVEAVVELRPDLILANQEENSRADLEALADKGIPIFVSLPKRFNDAIAHVARLAKLLGAPPPARELLREGYGLINGEPGEPGTVVAAKVFIPIWREPLMTFGADTYCDDLLTLAGGRNVFATTSEVDGELQRRSPLSADQEAGRDNRYPHISEDELIARSPELILLPNEPHKFTEDDKAYFKSLDVPAAKTDNIHFVDGKDLFWPGSRSVKALPRLRALLRSLAQ